jgi:pyruvate/2-oxoglutarate dehydrogenase complex dihydrolipoamide dehydrogenase (E3) component
MSAEPREYDVIVLGAGSTGENVADTAVQGGLTALVVERELVGGECSYWACMPSKALLRPPQSLGAARAVDGAKQAVTGRLDIPAVLRRRDTFTSHWKDDSQVEWLGSAHIDLIRGNGRITGEREVTVTGADGAITVVRARVAVVLATGSTAFLPPIDGLAEARPWTSRDATSARAIPRRLVILGGGVIGVEMATAYTALGSESVTVIEGSPRLLAKYEPFVSDAIESSLRDRGVDVRTGVKAVGVQRPVGGGPITVALEGGEEIEGDELLVAVGRRANTVDIGVESVGLEPAKFVDVDDTLRVTSVAGGWLYAAGDVNGRALLTHQGKYQGRAAGAAIAARARGEVVDGAPWSNEAATADHDAVPQVVFTEPEVASVGLSEAQAREKGYTVRTAEYEIGNVAGASVYADGYSGHAKMVVNADRSVVVGVTLVGPAVGEIIHAATVAIVGEVPLDRLWHAVPSYPTISELWLRLLETYRAG